MDATQRHEAIKAVLLDIVNEVAGPREALAGDETLVDELGLSSLDLARIVAVLELELGLDAFSDLVPVTGVRTVEDLLRAYDQAAQGSAPPAAEPVPPAWRPAARAARDIRAGVRDEP